MDTPRRAVPALCVVQFVDVLGVTIVISALPAMLRGVHAAPTAGALIVTGYAMCFGGLLMTGARVGDRYGHRTTLLAAIGVFGTGALLAALATSALMIAAARCVQGVAAAASVPAALRLLTTIAPEGDARRRAVAAWSATGAAAGASGFVVGGLLAETTGWRSVFWVNVLLAGGMALGLRSAVPPDRRHNRPRDRRLPLDLGGSAVLTATVMSVVVGTTLLGRQDLRPTGAVLVACAAPLATLLRAIERRTACPLLPRGALRVASLRAGGYVSFVNTATTSSMVTLAALVLQTEPGRSALSAAVTLVPFCLAVVLASALSPRVLRQLTLSAGAGTGLGLIAAAGAALSLAATAWSVPVEVAVAGLGLGLSSVAATTLGTAVPVALRGAAAGLINTAAQLGTATGTAAVLLLATLSGSATGWAAVALVAAASAVSMALAGRRDRPAAQAVSLPGSAPLVSQNE
jgi:MFS family permease